jgi:hypothetical protein
MSGLLLMRNDASVSATASAKNASSSAQGFSVHPGDVFGAEIANVFLMAFRDMVRMKWFRGKRDNNERIIKKSQ